MKSLNEEATGIFCALMAGMKEGYVHISNAPFMPLVLKDVGEVILQPYGSARSFRLSYCSTREHGLVQGPEMYFAVVDRRENPGDVGKVIIVPYLYSSPGRVELSASFDGNEFMSFKTDLQMEHAELADRWLRSIVADEAII